MSKSHPSGKQVLKALLKIGFVKVRQKSSHVTLKKFVQGRERPCIVQVPMHGNDELTPNVLNSISKQAGFKSKKELLDLL